MGVVTVKYGDGRRVCFILFVYRLSAVLQRTYVMSFSAEFQLCLLKASAVAQLLRIQTGPMIYGHGAECGSR